jgi:DNA modification methylase
VTGRICFGLEIDPRYADVIVCRWQEMTGQQAVLEGSGLNYDEVSRERRVIPKENYATTQNETI